MDTTDQSPIAVEGFKLLGTVARFWRTQHTAVGTDCKFVKVVGVDGHFLCLLPLNDNKEETEVGPFWLTGSHVANLELLEGHSFIRVADPETVGVST